MKFQSTSNVAILALFASTAHSFTYVGCFSSSSNLEFNSRSVYQSLGNCQQKCTAANLPVMGVTNGTDCLCGTSAPSQDSIVPDSSCDSRCTGYAEDVCGGEGFFSVYSIPDSAAKRSVETAPEVAISG
ncbi:hypothetical protein F4806DRAFT_494104 [Annulohypoxylon nitens]|nr:hypothetical protein F4806DRAFT_494104 [Annulohypoxylon nitens]